MDIEEFHERIIKFLVEEFVRRGFKYVSHIEGGFEDCHAVAMTNQIPLVVHKEPCYLCLKANNRKLLQSKYAERYNLNGFNNIFSGGFKVLYDMAS